MKYLSFLPYRCLSMLNVAAMGTILSFLISVSCKQSPTIAADKNILSFSVYKFLMAVPPFHSATVGTEDFFLCPTPPGNRRTTAFTPWLLYYYIRIIKPFLLPITGKPVTSAKRFHCIDIYPKFFCYLCTSISLKPQFFDFLFIRFFHVHAPF